MILGTVWNIIFVIGILAMVIVAHMIVLFNAFGSGNGKDKRRR